MPNDKPKRGRPITGEPRKIKLCITVSPEVYNYLKQRNASRTVERLVRTEIPGQ